MIKTHKIRIYPNNIQKTQIEESFGVARFTYNWILERYKKNSKDFSVFKLKTEFNSIKTKEYPFVSNVSKYVAQAEFIFFKTTQRAFKDSLISKRKIELHYKSKHDKRQAYYIGGDHTRLFKKEGLKCEYLKLPKMPALKLTEDLRYKGRIKSVTVEREYGDYYVAINLETETGKGIEHTNNEAIGVDLGIKNHLILSNGLIVNYPNSINAISEKIKKMQKQIARKEHPRTKDDKKVFSNNYMKQKERLDKAYGKLKNIKLDYEHKVVSILAKNYKSICIEDLTIKTMHKNKNIARRLQNVSFYRIRRQIEWKAIECSNNVIIADKFFPSSKKCSCCGEVKKELKLRERLFICPSCGLRIDRDLNAAINLKQLVGRVTSDFTPLDLENIISDFKKSNIDVYKVEEGI